MARSNETWIGKRGKEDPEVTKRLQTRQSDLEKAEKEARKKWLETHTIARSTKD